MTEAVTGETMSAQEIGKAWLAFLEETFMIESGCGRPEAAAELERLESEGRLQYEREHWRMAIDLLILQILDSPPEERQSLFAATDHASLALVQDRIRSGTMLLTGMAQKGLEVRMEGEAALPEFFQQILLQRV
ncbi:MAG TPA: hypothetical protein VIU41_04275 [Geobacteraceae bacterium]